MTFPRCDQCDRTIWCTEVHQDGYVFCSAECRDAMDGDNNVARTETGAGESDALIPAPATATLGTREPCVASVPSSSPARRPSPNRADLSGVVLAPASTGEPAC